MRLSLVFAERGSYKADSALTVIFPSKTNLSKRNSNSICSASEKTKVKRQFDYAMLMGLIFLLIVGAGHYSVDARLAITHADST